MSTAKILFTDLDGTLLNDQKQISDKNMLAIRTALSEGHKIVLSTGRALSSAIKQAEALGLSIPGCYIIAFNGGCIYNISEATILYEQSIPSEYVIYLFEEAKKQNLYIHTYDMQTILTLQEHEYLKRYAKNTSMDYKILSDLKTQLPSSVPKLLAIDFDHTHSLEVFAKSIQSWAKGKVDYFYSCAEYLEVVPLCVSKGNAIRYLCDLLGFSLSNTISAGDAENDISMLQTTAVGVVMKNASDSMKKYGNYITEHDNNHDGIAEVIYKFIL